MDEPSSSTPREPGSPFAPLLMGGVSLSEERLQALAPAWAATYRSLRSMDGLELGETEPATIFVWREQQ